MVLAVDAGALVVMLTNAAEGVGVDVEDAQRIVVTERMLAKTLRRGECYEHLEGCWWWVMW